MSSPVCNALFEAGQVEQLTGIPRPYLDTGVIIFKLTQLTPAPDDILNITLNAVPTNYGYTCEFLNANGTPAILWDIQTPYPFPTSIITLDSTVLPAKPIQSDNLVTTITQTAGLTSYWYNNIRNPLYMVCLGYQVITGTTDRQSHPVCGGTTGNTCISYLLQ